MEVERKEIGLSCLDGKDNQVSVLTMARVCGGLAMHKGIGRSRGYTLTHLASSVSLVTGIRLSVADQEKALKEIAAAMDWSKSYDEITSMWVRDTQLKERVFGLLKRLH